MPGGMYESYSDIREMFNHLGYRSAGSVAVRRTKNPIRNALGAPDARCHTAPEILLAMAERIVSTEETPDYSILYPHRKSPTVRQVGSYVSTFEEVEEMAKNVDMRLARLSDNVDSCIKRLRIAVRKLTYAMRESSVQYAYVGDAISSDKVEKGSEVFIAPDAGEHLEIYARNGWIMFPRVRYGTGNDICDAIKSVMSEIEPQMSLPGYDEAIDLAMKCSTYGPVKRLIPEHDDRYVLSKMRNYYGGRAPEMNRFSSKGSSTREKYTESSWRVPSIELPAATPSPNKSNGRNSNSELSSPINFGGFSNGPRDSNRSRPSWAIPGESPMAARTDTYDTPAVSEHGSPNCDPDRSNSSDADKVQGWGPS
jgi:hypothetical protein